MTKISELLSSASDGFDQTDQQADGQIIVGLREHFKDTNWYTGGMPADPKRNIVAVGTLHFIRRWKDQQVVKTYTDHPLPDVNELNAKIPIEQ